jgi:cystathionine beta-lyase family protein involved in aluminum resistance
VIAPGPSARKTSKQRKCAADYIAERALLTQRLDEFADQLGDEERAALIARFDGYSERNALLIAMQRPGATDVRGYRAWQEVGRQVRKGETGIRIVARAATKEQEETEAKARENDEQVLQRIRHKLVSVFDVSQTDPIAEESIA